MNLRLIKVIKISSATAIGFLLLGLVSRYQAQNACTRILADDVDPPPHYATHFVVTPSKYMDGASDFGFAPGWVVIFSPPNRNYGKAYFVGLAGKIHAWGQPHIVTEQKLSAHQSLSDFQTAFAQVDAAVQIGQSFAAALEILGKNIFCETNENGLIQAHVSYLPHAAEHLQISFLTNGFTLHISNGVIIAKEYSYLSAN